MRRIKTFVSGQLVLFLSLCLFISDAAWAVDLNLASQEQLMSIKGIGVKTAENIIQERQRGGPYLSLDDLSLRVKGIGNKRAKRLFEAGLQIKNQVLPTTEERSGGRLGASVNKKKKQSALLAAEPKLIKPLSRNANHEEK